MMTDSVLFVLPYRKYVTAVTQFTDDCTVWTDSHPFGKCEDLQSIKPAPHHISIRKAPLSTFTRPSQHELGEVKGREMSVLEDGSRRLSVYVYMHV